MGRFTQLLNFSEIHGNKRDLYLKAVQQGMKRNYEPMKEVFRKAFLVSYIKYTVNS